MRTRLQRQGQVSHPHPTPGNRPAPQATERGEPTQHVVLQSGLRPGLPYSLSQISMHPAIGVQTSGLSPQVAAPMEIFPRSALITARTKGRRSGALRFDGANARVGAGSAGDRAPGSDVRDGGLGPL